MSTATAAAPSASAAGTSYGSPSYRLYVLLVLTLVYTLNFIDRTLLGVVAQPIITEFNLNDTQYGFLNGPPFAIFYAIMGIPLAAAADRYNRVVIICLCIATWSVMCALCGIATSFLFLLIFRVGVAIGEAGCTPPANSLLADYFSPKSRANALGIYATGVTIGGALAYAFGGPIAQSLNGPNFEAWLNGVGLSFAANMMDWSEVEGWRIAFVVIGAPGVLIALLLLLTVKEPPRGYSDPPGAARPAKASFVEAMKELSRKPTFWSMSIGAALVAFVGYGLFGFQAPLAQRVAGIGPGEFALKFGVPLSLIAALGTFIGGFLSEKLSSRSETAVAWIPAAGLFASIPLYIWGFYTIDTNPNLALVIWCAGALSHYAYLGSQYTIGQGVVSMRARATAIAVLLLLISLIGNGLGPQFLGIMSDMFTGMQITANDPSGSLAHSDCLPQAIGQLEEAQQAICRAAYGEGLRQAMSLHVLFFIPAAALFLVAATTLKKDMVAR